jgi:hypothetical protein
MRAKSYNNGAKKVWQRDEEKIEERNIVCLALYGRTVLYVMCRRA